MTDSPWFSWSKTADMSGAAGAAAGGGGTPGGGGGGGGTPPGTFRVGTGGGGGGGGAAPPAAGPELPALTCLRASWASIPSLSFQVRPLG